MTFYRNISQLLLFVILCAQPLSLEGYGDSKRTSLINTLFARKIELYLNSLPERQRQYESSATLPRSLGPTLRFLYEEAWLGSAKHGFVVPELGSLFEDEAANLFGNITYIKTRGQEITFELSLHFLLATLRSFDPTRLTSLLIAYTISRRAVFALVLERYLLVGTFTEEEVTLISDISLRLYQLHRQSAHTKRIIEFFHVSKSGGTSFCQLGRLNGCKTESFGKQGNCLITYFRDHPRWTQPGVLTKLSEQYGDPWCARFGKQYSFRWHCKARRQYLTRMRFNIYSNELVMHDHNRTWAGVHPCREFLNVVIFREPESRVISHMQNILKEYVQFYNESFWTAFNPDSPEQWRALAVPVFDNYVVRSLLGGQAYNMPYGAVNATHLLAAKIVTLQFEVLLSLTPQTSELTHDIFGMGLGWHYDLRHHHARSTENRAVKAFAPAVMEAVHAGRHFDQQLYDFALVLQLLDALVFGVAKSFAAPDGAIPAAVDATGHASPLNSSVVVAPKKSRRRCGYVGFKHTPSASGLGPLPSAGSDVELLLKPFGLPEGDLGELLGEVPSPLDKLGGSSIAGGRWFNGTFYLNSSEAVEAAVIATKAALDAAKEALTAKEALAMTAA